MDAGKITAYAVAWCRKRKVRESLWGDAIQEAWAAGLKDGATAQGISRALDRFRKAEYRQPAPMGAAAASVEAKPEQTRLPAGRSFFSIEA